MTTNNKMAEQLESMATRMESEARWVEDPESTHWNVDKVLIDALEAVAETACDKRVNKAVERIVKAWKQAPKWYA